MIIIDIQGFRNLKISHAVFDYNGTLATDGYLDSDVKEMLLRLSDLIEVHVVTADTFGRAKEQLSGFKGILHILEPGDEAIQKKEYCEKLQGEIVSFGNGRNDRHMFAVSAVSIGILGKEGLSVESLKCADILVDDIRDAIYLLFNPLRLKATLRE